MGITGNSHPDSGPSEKRCKITIFAWNFQKYGQHFSKNAKEISHLAFSNIHILSFCHLIYLEYHLETWLSKPMKSIRFRLFFTDKRQHSSQTKKPLYQEKEHGHQQRRQEVYGLAVLDIEHTEAGGGN